MPDADSLKKIRQEIDYNFSNFKEIVLEKRFFSQFGTLSTENKLVNAPKGYETDNIALEYLKLKSFTTSVSISSLSVNNECLDRN